MEIGVRLQIIGQLKLLMLVVEMQQVGYVYLYDYYQWRFDTFTHQSQTVYFPISFTYEIFLICTQNQYGKIDGSSLGWFSSVPLSWQLDSIKVYYCDKKGFLLAIGN